jgi:sugar lactone lactonase YvrE
MRAVIRSLTLAVPMVVVLLVFPAVAQADELPSLAWSPTTSSGAFDFGTVAVGQAVSQIFTLTNSGGSASSALTLALTGSPAFTITPDRCIPTSLGPGRDCTITVNFVPDGSGTDTATLSATGEKSAATAALSLTGTGAIPGHIYWSNSGDGTITRAHLDGSDPTILVSRGEMVNDARGVAVDASHLYWSDFTNGAIDVANLDGTDPQPLVPAQEAGAPRAIAVDASHVYWSDTLDSTIDVANLDGSNPRILVAGPISALGVAVDANHIYWSNALDSTIDVANLDGSNPHTLISAPPGPFTQPAGVAVDASHVYWADFANGTINDANLDGTPTNTHPLVSGEASAFGVAVDAGHIYWTDVFGGSIRAANLDGSNPQTLVGGQHDPFTVAVGA